MAFLDKVSSVAKDIADGAKSVAGNAMLSIKISGIEHEISELKTKLGETVWAFHSCKAEDGLNPHEKIDEICTEIQNAYNKIDALNSERDKPEDDTPIDINIEERVRMCRECGAILKEDWYFCPICGRKCSCNVDSSVPYDYEVAKKSCTECGTELTDLQNFCPICGTKR